MLFPATLRRARQHLLKCSCRNRSAGPLLGGRREGNSSFARDIRSRAIGHCSAINLLRTSIADASPYPLLTLPPILFQNAYFSTKEEENTIGPLLLIDTTQENPDVYSSPSGLLTSLWEKDDMSCPLSASCKSIIIEKDGKDETWYTAIYAGQRKDGGEEYFHSGKFGGFIDRFCKSSFSSEPTCVVDGKIYYQSEHLAKEAAAARALDCIAFRTKYLSQKTATQGIMPEKESMGTGFWVAADDRLKPLRYCVERPYPYPMFGNDKTLNSSKDRNSHSPFYFWSCMMEAKYGPIDVVFDVQSFSVNKSGAGTREGESEETWFSAECIEPKTREAFGSGVFGLALVGDSLIPDAPTTPLPLEEFDFIDGRVCYRDEMTAKHAAAARAIDCLELRAGNRIEKESNLCLEEPYLASTDKQHMRPTNYEKLKATVQKRRSGDPNISFSDIPKFRPSRSDIALRHWFIEKHNQLRYKRGVIGSFGKGYELMMLISEGRQWFTANFIDPVSKEKFPSGVVKGKPEANICIIDGRVCFERCMGAINASASRAMDCYHLREETAAGRATTVRLCYEEPYKKGELETQAIDYQTILTQRESDCKKILSQPENYVSGLPSFSLTASRRPYLFHVPKHLLTNALQAKYRYGSQKVKDFFTTKEKENEGQTYFTSIFTEPTTKEQFPSGLLGKVDVEKNPSYCPKPPLHLAPVKILNGTVYYRLPQIAEHAAAARAIDCHIFREERADLINVRLCLEDPYMTQEDGASQSVDYDQLLHQRENYVLQPPAFVSESPFSLAASRAPHLFHVPKKMLTNALQVNYGSDLKTQHYFTTNEKEHEGQILFTAIFTEPTTKEQFTSGLLGEVDVEKKTSAGPKTPFHLAPVKILNGRVYYRSRHIAEHAAAARAIDCQIFREERADLINFRLCLEDPYMTQEDGASQSVDYDQLLHQSHLPPANNQAHTDSFPNEENDEIGQMEPIQEELPTLDLTVTNSQIRADSTLSTMGRIAEVWIDFNDLGSWAGASYLWPFESANVQPREKVAHIMEWYDQVNHAPQSREEAAALAQLCSKILQCLGNCNGEMLLHEKENRTSVEDDAKAILENIISMARNFDDQYLLDADVLNSWMRCLDPSDPIRSAKSAKNLLMSMENREKYGGIDLPPPNVDTYNAVMSVWANVDGIEGKNGVNYVNSLLENASLGFDSKCPLHPNKETFKILLAANSKIDGLFSFEQAKSSLARIQKSSASGEAFIADADIYAAALSSMPTAPKGRPASNGHASWLKCGDQYAGGFKAANERADMQVQAEDMENWFLHAEGCGVIPSEEMYESVIQGWIETGTKDGLLEAEQWGIRAILSNSPISLKTFYPIIAACAQLPSPNRVKEWNEKLAAMRTEKPHLTPDLNTLSAHIIAWSNVQRGIVDTVKDTEKSSSDDNEASTWIGYGSEKKSLEKTFAAAQHCTTYLKEIYSNYNWLEGAHDTFQDTQALITMFAYAVETWGRAARFALLHSPSSASLDTSHGVREMLKIARHFDAEIDGEVPEKSVQNMTSLIGECYVATISQLYQIDSTADSDAKTTCYFAEKISHVERMLRDYEFFTRKHLSRSNSTSYQKSLRHRLYKEILQGCAGVQASADFGHVVRLCSLIMDHLSWHDKQCNGGHLEDISPIYVDIALLMRTVVRSPYERMYVLTTIYNNASHFFEQKNKTRASMYATVDKARLIGAMRLAMDGSELTDDFIRNFDDRALSKRRARDNTAMAFVEDMVKRT